METQENSQLPSDTQEPEVNATTNPAGAFFVLLVIVLFALYYILNRNQWEFLIWEAFIALIPFAIVSLFLQYIRQGKWHEFIGSTELLPWALTISALSLKRVWGNGLSEFYLVINIVLMFLAAIVFGFASLAKRTAMASDAERQESLRKMTWASFAVAAVALIVGLIIAGAVPDLR